MERLKIVHVTPFYHFHINGVANVTRNIAERLARLGHEIHVVSMARDYDGNQIGPLNEEVNGVRVHRLPSVLDYRNEGGVIRGLGELIRRLRPNIVHLHCYRHPHSVLGAIAARRIGAKVLLHGHSPFHDQRFIPKLQFSYYVFHDIFFPPILKHIYDRIIAIHPGEAEAYMRLGFSPRKIRVIPNGVDSLFFEEKDPSPFLETYDIPLNRPIILNLARIDPQKGTHAFIKVIEIVADRYPDVLGIIVGSCPSMFDYYRKMLESLVVKMGLENNVMLLGWLPDELKPSAYRASKIYVLPSLAEGLSLTVLEALASGTPVITTTVGGNSFVIKDGVNGYLVQPIDVKAIADRTIHLLRNEKNLLEMSREARLEAMKHRWHIIVSEIENEYFELVD